MDLTPLLGPLAPLLAPLLQGNPWLLVVGGAVVILLQRYGIKLPFAPVPAPSPPPNPSPAPAPAPTGRPLLDLLLKLLGGSSPPAPAQFADAVKLVPLAEQLLLKAALDAHHADVRAALAPEPARPVV